MARKPVPVPAPVPAPEPPPFKPTRFVFPDATGTSDWRLCLGTEKLGTDGGSLPAFVEPQGKIALCFGMNEYNDDFSCDAHLSLKQVDAIIKFLTDVRSQITLLDRPETETNNDCTVVR